jgi:SAM-dependent methyltransferase
MSLVNQEHDSVQEYYGKVLHGSNDLKTNACCSIETLPDHLKKLVRDIEPEVLERFYGCGAPIPPVLEGCTVLDLGCGTGRDVYLASKLVGPEGRVIGVDMTDEQLEVAERCLPRQMERYGFETPNVKFRKGYIEDLASVGIEDESIDVVISDCVINLAVEKKNVFKEIFRVLKPGGELHFSDVYADRRLPADLMHDPVLHGECLAGALYTEDFRRIMQEIGCPDVREVSRGRITIDNPEIEARLGMARFDSVTIRAFKLDSIEDRCEDYGQVAYYQGNIPDYPHQFALDDHHLFETGKPMLVCGNTAAMIQETRLSPHFNILGDRTTHFGLFDCLDSGDTRFDTSGSCC